MKSQGMLFKRIWMKSFFVVGVLYRRWGRGTRKLF